MNLAFEQGFNRNPSANPYEKGTTDHNIYDDGLRAGRAYRKDKKNLPPEEALEVGEEVTKVEPEPTTPEKKK